MRKAFTLVEILVIIAIIAIIIALMIPAILQLRVKSGKVIDKTHQDAYTELNTTIDTDGNPHIDFDYIDEQWGLTIKGEKGVRHLGVSEYYYNNIEVGDYIKIEDGVPVKLTAEQ